MNKTTTARFIRAVFLYILEKMCSLYKMLSNFKTNFELTTRKKCAIIIHVVRERQLRDKNHIKIFRRNFEKGIDKVKEM